MRKPFLDYETWRATYETKLADAFLRLPPARTVPNAVQRQVLQSTFKQRTWSELWQCSLICMFSSAQPSGQASALDNFQHSNSPLLRLDDVLAARNNPQWVSLQLQGWGFRFPNKLAKIARCMLPFFQDSGGSDRPLASQTRDAGPLQLFVDLARGRQNDADIAASSRFSATLSARGLYGMGHKQLRNVLVNTGLASNVVPIDSRWRTFLQRNLGLETTAANMQNRYTYLALEELIRGALILVQPARLDLTNMAILDAIVFFLGEPSRQRENRGANHSACRGPWLGSYGKHVSF